MHYTYGTTQSTIRYACSGKTTVRVQTDQRLDGFGLMDYNARDQSSATGSWCVKGFNPCLSLDQTGEPANLQSVRCILEP